MTKERLIEIAEQINSTFPETSYAINNDIEILKIIHDDNESVLQDEIKKLIDAILIEETVILCGCGILSYTYIFLRDLLNKIDGLLKNNDAGERLVSPTDIENEFFHVDHSNRASEEYKRNIGIYQYVLYTLNSSGILDHGAAIRYSVLTQTGEILLELLNAYDFDRED